MDGSMSGQAIYDNFAHNSLAGLAHPAHLATRICESYDMRVSELKNVRVNSYGAWLGAASEAARLAGEPVITSQEIAVPHIYSAALSMVQQADIFEVAKHSVVPVPPMPEKPGFWDNLFSPTESRLHYAQQVIAVHVANDHNIEVMAAYERATQQNLDMLTRIPGTPEPPAPVPPIDPSGPPSDPQPWVPGPGESPPSGGGPQPDAQRTETSKTQPDVPLPAPERIPDTTVGRTHANLAEPAPIRITIDSGPPRTTQPGMPAPSPTPIGPIGNARGFGPDGRGSEAARPGRGSGFGPHGTPPAPLPGSAKPASTPGRGGPGGQPPMGNGARARGEEDLERDRPSYLVEPDPEETFGTDQVTAPPVIGA